MIRRIYRILLIGAILGFLSFALMDCSNDEEPMFPAAPDVYHWISMGSPGLGWNTASSIAIDPSDNKPVVVFRDMVDGRPHVMKWDSGTTWTDLGFLTTAFGDHPSLTIDPSDNKPVVVFVDNLSNGKARVKKWDSGTTWTDLGFPSTGDCRGWWRPPSITIDPSDNKPVVVFVDADNGWKAQVKKWDSGTTWTDLGFPSTGVASYPSIVIDPSDNKPVVVFVDAANGEKTHVKKWSSGTSWTDLGFASTGVTSSTVIAIDPSDNKPVVAFVDNPTTPKVQVKKWSSGTTWTDLGFPGVRDSEYPSIVIDTIDNNPIVAIRDWQGPDPDIGGTFIHVKKWSGGTTWTGLGFPIKGDGFVSSITIDPSDNKPVVLCTDTYDADSRVYVAKHP